MTIYDEKLNEMLSFYEDLNDLFKFELESCPQGKLIYQDNCGNNQVIVAENELPETLDYSGVHLMNFTMGDEEGERYGFLRSVRN